MAPNEIRVSCSTRQYSCQVFLWNNFLGVGRPEVPIFPFPLEFMKFYNISQGWFDNTSLWFCSKVNFWSLWIIFAMKILPRKSFTASKTQSLNVQILLFSWDTIILLWVDLIFYLYLLTSGYQPHTWVALIKLLYPVECNLFHEQGFFFIICFCHH